MNYFTSHEPYQDYATAYTPGPSLYSDLSPPLKAEQDTYAIPGLQPDPEHREGPWTRPRQCHSSDSSTEYAFTGPSESLVKVGGFRPTIVLVASLVILAAGCFSIVAQHAHIVFKQSVFNSRWINASTISALLTFLGTVLVAGYINVLGLIGRIWLWKQIENRRRVRLGQVMVIASNGAIDELLYAFSIGKASFIIAVALVWIISPAISGALQPTWGRQTDLVVGNRRYFHISGSGVNDTLPVLVDCFDRAAPSRCPAREYYADHHMSMQYSLGGYSSYYQSFGVYQNTTPPASIHMEVAETWRGISSRRLNSARNVVTATACVPVINSTVSCAITRDPPGLTITGGRVAYPTVCGQVQIGDANDSPGGGYVNTCPNGSGNASVSLYYTFVPASGTGSAQVRCDIGVFEAYRWSTYHNANIWYEDQGACADGRIDQLTYAETIPLVSSVAYVLAGSSTSASSTQSGGDNPLFSDMQAWLLANTAQSVERIQLMVQSGVSTASTFVYAMGYRNNEGTPSGRNMEQLDAWVVYGAYTWSGGFKGYLWAGFLIVAALCGMVVSIAAFFVPRLRYDPGSFAQTMFTIRQPRLDGDTSIAVRPLPRKYEDLPLMIHR
ncbi:hypothetical protein NCC49_000372 [Naganishia albida]|nr:hypothetical protein NCC49_000372 [Naganishia albida]